MCKERYLVRIPNHPEADGYMSNPQAAVRVLSYYFITSGTGSVYDLYAKRGAPWRWIMREKGKLACAENRPLQLNNESRKRYYGEKYYES